MQSNNERVIYFRLGGYYNIILLYIVIVHGTAMKQTSEISIDVRDNTIRNHLLIFMPVFAVPGYSSISVHFTITVDQKTYFFSQFSSSRCCRWINRTAKYM